jgi:hypothetical protein
MADRYAVATGNWNATSTWSDSDGGAPGASAPVNGDNAYLTATSGAITVTVSAAAACTTLTCTGFTGTLAFGSFYVTVAGNVTLGSGMTVPSTTSGGIAVSAAATVAGGGLASFPAAMWLTGTGAVTLTASGTTWGTLTISGGAKTVTLGAALTATTLNISDNWANTTFAGAYDITAATFWFGYSTGSVTLTLVSGQTLTVTGAMRCFGAPKTTYSHTIKSSTASSSTALVYSGASADCAVASVTFTDVAYSGSTVTVLDNWYGGTLTRCGDTFFTISSGSATAGATYTNNGATFTVTSTVASGTKLICTRSGLPAESGTLTKASGTGDATLTFSAYTTGGITNRTSADIGGGTGGVTGRCLQLGVGVC